MSKWKQVHYGKSWVKWTCRCLFFLEVESFWNPELETSVGQVGGGTINPECWGPAVFLREFLFILLIVSTWHPDNTCLGLGFQHISCVRQRTELIARRSVGNWRLTSGFFSSQPQTPHLKNGVSRLIVPPEFPRNDIASLVTPCVIHESAKDHFSSHIGPLRPCRISRGRALFFCTHLLSRFWRPGTSRKASQPRAQRGTLWHCGGGGGG